MILEDIRRSIEANSPVPISMEREELAERVHDAVLVIARKIEPDYLKTLTEEGSLRQIDDKVYLRTPVIAEQELDRVELDDILARAVANYVVAGKNPRHASVAMGIFYDELRMYTRAQNERETLGMKFDTQEKFG